MLSFDDVTTYNTRAGVLLSCFDSSPPGQNGRLFADDIFRCIFVNEKFCIPIKKSWKFVPKGPFDNNQALLQIMVPNRRQAIIWTNADLIHWHIYGLRWRRVKGRRVKQWDRNDLKIALVIHNIITLSHTLNILTRPIRWPASLLAKIYNFWQVCSFVGLSVCLSVCLSVLSSITHGRFDI